MPGLRSRAPQVSGRAGYPLPIDLFSCRYSSVVRHFKEKPPARIIAERQTFLSGLAISFPVSAGDN
jgi:hypothetical protein